VPLTLRSKQQLLETLIDAVLAGGRITDMGLPSAVRQMFEGIAANESEADFSLYTLLKSFYITPDNPDLDARGLDMGLARDPGQAASDPVVYTRVQTWLEDIDLLAPQVLQATLADGTAILYRSLGDSVLLPQGRSISGQGPGTTLVSGTNNILRVNLDSDGLRTLTLATQTTAAGIAATIQTVVRALTAVTPGNQPAYTGFRCDYDTTTPGAYTLRSGSTGPTSTVVVTAGATQDATTTLKLGLVSGGLESPGQDTVDVALLCDTVGVIGNVGAGQIQTQVSPVAGIQTVANALAFSNGREPASNDAYCQDLRNYLPALGVGGDDAVPRAVYGTRGSDGQTHVMSAQVVSGVGTIQVSVCDGRSLTIGAQADVVQDVQDELDGLGTRVGGWIPNGTTVGVIPATIMIVDVDVTVTVGPTPDRVFAHQALTTALYSLIYQWPQGTELSDAQMTRRIDETVVEMFGVLYTTPVFFTMDPRQPIPAVIGQKFMPGSIVVEVVRA
jgi:uncharacterized phage protein gp47/JayE